jgi:peptidoglycan/xylan/chitin deacetylase (PgdA/CDA1 family)
MFVTFSFDTELAWGGLAPEKARILSEDSSYDRESIRFLLNQLDRFGIPATWGIVGSLLVEEWPDGSDPIPDHLQGANPDELGRSHPLYHMPELIEWIEDANSEHEIAGHSFSHPRFGDLSKEQARGELTAMSDAFQLHGCTLNSVIHPYIDVAHCDLLSEFSISAYSLGVETKARTLRDGLYPFLKQDSDFWSCPLVEPFIDDNELVAIPRSRQLSDERWGWLNPRRVRNTLNAGDDGLLHLTLHPHNLLYDPFLKTTLPRLLETVARKRDEGEVSILTFEELSAQLR